MNREQRLAYDLWLADKPDCIKSMAERFTPNSIFEIEGETYYMCGFAEVDTPEGVALVLSKIDPSKDYDAAMANTIRICASHFAEVEIQ